YTLSVRNDGEVGYADVRFGVAVSPHWVPRFEGWFFGNYYNFRDVYETYNDYLFNWESAYRDILDTRLQLSYQYVTNATDIYGALPAVAQLPADGTVSITAGRDARLDAFTAVEADRVTIDAAGDIALSGAITATNAIEATAGTDGSGSIIGDIDAQLATTGGD